MSRKWYSGILGYSRGRWSLIPGANFFSSPYVLLVISLEMTCKLMYRLTTPLSLYLWAIDSRELTVMYWC